MNVSTDDVTKTFTLTPIDIKKMAADMLVVNNLPTFTGRLLWSIYQTAVSHCMNCPTMEDRNRVFGAGSQSADIMFIGEAPGKVENEQCQPFVGPAGQIFNEALEAYDIPRETVFITNCVLCWPPNRSGSWKPSDLEVNNCRTWLAAQIALVEPKVIVLLGASAYESITGELDVKMYSVIDKKYILKYTNWQNEECAAIMLPTYHPSALQYQDDQKEKDRMGLTIGRAIKLAKQLTGS